MPGDIVTQLLLSFRDFIKKEYLFTNEQIFAALLERKLARFDREVRVNFIYHKN